MMNKCTWKNCTNDGKIPQLDRIGHQWALLCKEHDEQLSGGIINTPFNPKIALKNWVLAHGGAEKMVEDGI